MQLYIRKTGPLSDIQEEFSRYFPYLKIEFYRLPHTEKKLSPKNEKLDRYTPVSRVVKWENDKVIEFNEKMTVSQFEAMMDYEAGLFVQIARQSGRVWIETSYTDNWTLEEQNEQGKIMSSIHEASSEKQGDWEDWDNQ